ncbi:MAG: HoxN/HupN/NixA family nickel/cobalt transporter [Hyphomicrobiales bacterium]|nr:HoxN/HupN/NixA family nickel/cobalt transporter [Hyphomicrobiales bacterium]
MSRTLLRLFDDGANHLTARIVALYTLLIAANAAVWIWALISFRDHPLLLGTCVLAYAFGLRHAVDADHIAAIDNVTRKLMQEGKRPVTSGFFFSLGHSTVVILATVGVALAAAAFQEQLEEYRAVGSMIGLSVSSAFLLLIAIINIVVLINVYKAFRRVKNGSPYTAEDLDTALAGHGLLTRIFRRLFRSIRHSWQLYPLGFLFALGFDTATEIGLLAIAAAQGSSGLPIWSILVFPALFTAGMTLVDTTDSVLMTGTYGWAFVKPVRKLYYNLTITFASVLVAVLIGGVQALNLIAGKFELSGGIWDAVGDLNEVFSALGFAIIGVFIACWLLSMLVYRLKGYDRLEVAPVPAQSSPSPA